MSYEILNKKIKVSDDFNAIFLIFESYIGVNPLFVSTTKWREFRFRYKLFIVVKLYFFFIHIYNRNHIKFTFFYHKFHFQNINWFSLLWSPSILSWRASFFIMKASIKNINCITIFRYLIYFDLWRHINNSNTDMIILALKYSQSHIIPTCYRKRLQTNQRNVIFTWS